MHDPEPSPWRKGIEYLEVLLPGSTEFSYKCQKCGKTCTNKNYMKYQHQQHCPNHQRKGTLLEQTSIRKYLEKDNENDSETIKIVRFLCENAVSINATQSKSFSDLFSKKYDDKTIRKQVIDYAEKLKSQTKDQIKDLIVSLVIDGATLNDTSGWYAVGLATRTNIYFYDVYHVASSTTKSLSHLVNSVIEEIEKETRAKVVGASTDNADNIKNVFDPNHSDGISKLYGKHLLRIPCQAHTTNLVVVTYEREDPHYSELISQIKSFAKTAHEKCIHEAIGIKKRCPMMREQRWFTEYDCLDWIITNKGKIEAAFPVIADLMKIKKSPITDEWGLLHHALGPLRYYTTIVESNICSIGRSYKEFKSMKYQLEMMKNNKFAIDLLQIIEKRWSSTADINLLWLADFVAPDKYIKWQDKKQTIANLIAKGESTTEQEAEFVKMQDELDLAIKTTIKYSYHMGYIFDDDDQNIGFLLATGKIPRNRRADYYWEGMKAVSGQFEIAAKLQNVTGIDVHKISDVCEFYCKIRSLPSSEAFCERIFSNMRLLFPKSRSSSNDDLVRAQTLIRMVMSLDNEY